MAVPPNQKPSWIKAHGEGMVMSVVEERLEGWLFGGFVTLKKKSMCPYFKCIVLPTEH